MPLTFADAAKSLRDHQFSELVRENEMLLKQRNLGQTFIEQIIPQNMEFEHSVPYEEIDRSKPLFLHPNALKDRCCVCGGNVVKGQTVCSYDLWQDERSKMTGEVLLGGPYVYTCDNCSTLPEGRDFCLIFPSTTLYEFVNGSESWVKSYVGEDD